MEISADTISQVEKVKHDFEANMKASLINDAFKGIVTRAIPVNAEEKTKLNDPDFRSKLSSVLSPVAQEMVNKFDHVGQFDSGNLMTSLVNSVSDSVSLEANYRQQQFINQVALGRVNQDNWQELNTALESYFSNVKEFTNKEIETRFKQNCTHIFTVEDANGVIERIKNDVKSAIEETEAKNDLVEGTTQEIVNYKEEIAPPDDEYEDPNEVQSADPDDPDAADAGGDEEVPDDETMYQGDDGMGEDGGDDAELPDTESQTYDGDDTGGDEGGENPDITEDFGDEGTDEAPDGEDGEDDLDPESEDPNAENGLDDLGEGDGEGDNLEGGEDGAEGDAGDETGDDDALGDDAMGDNGDDLAAGDDAGDMPPPDDGAGGGSDGGNNVTDGASNNNSGGITININGADLKAAKESLDLWNARALAESRIPVNPVAFNNMRLPKEADLASECVNAVGDCSKEFANRLDYLKLAVRQSTTLSQEQSDAINEKIDVYGKLIGNALDKARQWKRSMETAGITSQGLVYGNEDQFIQARNILNRFIVKKQYVNPTVKPYRSKEEVFANAFDIMQLRSTINRRMDAGKPVAQVVIDDLQSRENVFYHNMVNFDNEEVKKEAVALIDLSLMNWKKAISPNFITDYKIKAYEVQLGNKANKDMNEEVVKRVKSKFERLWNKELNEDEMKIIRATTNNDDATEILSTPYEKFAITMSKETLMARGSEDSDKGALAFSPEEKKSIEWRSRLMTTVYKACEAFGLFGNDEHSSFNKFNTLIGM